MDLITALALAKVLNLSVETIWRYTRQKRIPYIELGDRQYRYKLEQVVQALSGSEVRESQPVFVPDPDKTYTYQDYLALPDEPRFRWELLEGELVRDPSPSLPHQRITRRLLLLLTCFFSQADPQGEVFCAPLDVTLGQMTVVQPDLMYVAGNQRQIMKQDRVDGAPALVAEVLSPANRRKDGIRKLTLYQKAGVEHLWLVDPEDKYIQCFRLRDGFYNLTCSGMDDEVVEPPGFTGLEMQLASLWEGNDTLE